MPHETKIWTIYALVDPTTTTVRYIGWTTSKLAKRLSSHKSECLRRKSDGTWYTHYYRVNWLRQLYLAGTPPIIQSVEVGCGLGAAEAEQKWIKYYREQGANLVNGTDGGEGAVGVVWSDDRRQCMSDLMRTRAAQMTDAEREILAVRFHRVQSDPLYREKVNAGIRRPEVRAANSIRQRTYMANHPDRREFAKATLLRGVTTLWSTPELKEKALVNMRASAKKRRGSGAYNAKLNDDAVRDIRQGAQTPYKGFVMAMARKYGVDKKLINLVIKRKIWVDTPDEPRNSADVDSHTATALD